MDRNTNRRTVGDIIPGGFVRINIDRFMEFNSREREQIGAWLRANNINPNTTVEFEVKATHIVSRHLTLDDMGRIIVDGDGEPFVEFLETPFTVEPPHCLHNLDKPKE